MPQAYETDWLASSPVFYNEKTGKVSNNINDVIDFDDLEFHPEGFNNYLDFGYSVFEQTPVKNVKFLRHSSRLTTEEAGSIKVEYLDDPAEKWACQISKEKDVWEHLEAAVQAWEKQVDGEIVIPTSGGFDSRVLNLLINDKSRIRSFTYGVSNPQSASYEVVHAKKLSELLGTKWEQVELGGFHQHFDDWDRLYGPATHAHGMYTIEFFKKIKGGFAGALPLLSGIIGDAWAGGKKFEPIDTISSLYKLGLTHGMHADSHYSLLNSKPDQREFYFECVKDKIKDPFWVTVESMRFKFLLLSYLLRVPESLGFLPWSPFLDINIALSMLTISPKRRNGRAWQVEYFRKKNVYFENQHLKVNTENSLNFDATRAYPPAPLDISLMREVMQPGYVKWINNIIREMPLPNPVLKSVLNIRKVGGILRRAGFRSRNVFLEAYCAYLTLKPIENLLKRRNEKPVSQQKNPK